VDSKKLKAEFEKLDPLGKKALLETLQEMRKPEKLAEIGEGLERGKKMILSLLKKDASEFKMPY
jgi:hypothetical protein